MKKYLIIVIVLIVAMPSVAQTTMKQAFLAAPDSILPLMTEVNRLDCIDFIENNMKAQVKDRFESPVVLEALTTNYLRLKTSDQSTTEWKLISCVGNANDTIQYIVMVNTCSAPASDSNAMLYSTDWKKIKDIERPDINLFFKEECDMQSDSILTLKAEILTLPLMTATLSPDDSTITWAIETSELTTDTKKTAANNLQPITKPITITP